MVDTISYIIGFRQSNAERKVALVFVLKKLRQFFPNLEIIVVEQDSSPILSLPDHLNIQHIFIPNGGLYNRCWAFNVGVQHSQKSAFAFADADIFLTKEDYLTCFDALRYFEAVTPNRTEAINVHILGKNGDNYEALDIRPLFTFAGGLVLLTKEAFLKIGGWDERFEGWGCEDEAISHVLYDTLKTQTLYLPLYHIDHPRNSADGNEQAHYLENRHLMEEILSMDSHSLLRYIDFLKKYASGNPNKYHLAKPQSPSAPHFLKKLTFVLAITTYNRLDYLQTCVESFLKTKNPHINWQLIIADDGSTDGTQTFLKKLETEHGAIIIQNERVHIHHQVNSILKKLSSMDFDLCFKADDDAIFKQAGWDILYWKTIQRTGYHHLVYYDKSWRPHANLERPITQGTLVANCPADRIQGAFYTLTKSVVQQVGYFDTQRFGKSGLGHIDYTFRCCRAGFNVLRHPFDVKGSNDYIQLQDADTYTSSLLSKYKSLTHTKEVIQYKKALIQHDRIYIPYNENMPPLLPASTPITTNKKTAKTFQKVTYQKADATFYPERGVSGLLGFVLKKVYNFSIDTRLYFIPNGIKKVGRLLNKLSIDLMNIEE